MKKIVTVMALVLATASVQAETYNGPTTDLNAQCNPILKRIVGKVQSAKSEVRKVKAGMKAQFNSDADQNKVLGAIRDSYREAKSALRQSEAELEAIGAKVEGKIDAKVDALQRKVEQKLIDSGNGGLVDLAQDIDAFLDAQEEALDAGLAQSASQFRSCKK